MNLKHEKYGELRWGLNSTPKDNIVKDTNVTKLEDTYFGDIDMNCSFLLRPKGFNNAEGLSTIRWSDIARCYSNTDAFDCSLVAMAPLYRLNRRASASAGAIMRTTFGAPAFATSRPRSGRTGRSAAASLTRIFVTSAFTKWRRRRRKRALPASLEQPNLLQARHQGVGRVVLNQKRADRPVLLRRVQRFSAQDDSNAVHGGVFNGASPPEYNGYDLQVGIQREFEMLRLGDLGETSFFGGYKNLKDGISCGSNGNGSSLGRIPKLLNRRQQL